jgi:EAL domain-containing protein (putative c-di-GMP-specific phosphodiesterase class I)
MYRAKAQGASRYAVFDRAMHDEIMQMSQLENDLRRAVDSLEDQSDPQFQLYYQPIVLLSSSTISGFEALIRWQHPTRGLLCPAQFISMAEETGLIISIGRWVLREACRQLQTWQVTFGFKASLTIAVNVSVRQFLQPNLVEQVKQILRETDLNPGSLKLEITESLVIENPEEALAMLTRIKALGVQLAIDDFGLGYSSLSRLHSFRVNTLKIDRSFVSRLGIDGENSEIIQAIVILAHLLGISVTAEGVETPAQLAQLKMLACEEGQGYLFARPLTSQAAELLLSTAPSPRV